MLVKLSAQKIKLVGLFIFASIIIYSNKTIAQDTTNVSSDTSETAYSADNVVIGEIELMEITIEAEIEKPRVSILPKRIEPELGEMEFIDRSFENELKKGPDKPFLIDERIKAPVKVKKIEKNKKQNK